MTAAVRIRALWASHYLALGAPEELLLGFLVLKNLHGYGTCLGLCCEGVACYGIHCIRSHQCALGFRKEFVLM